MLPSNVTSGDLKSLRKLSDQTPIKYEIKFASTVEK
jgi:hypothetical protein